MLYENLNLEEITAARRRALEASLLTISREELKRLPDLLDPNATHPYLEQYLSLINDPATGPFHHGQAGDGIEVLFCEQPRIGMWYIRDSGMGRLEPDQLATLAEIVQAGARAAS
jgi:hypothetical protein